MALGTLAGIGIKGLRALLDVDEKTMVKLMSDTPIDDAAHLLRPEIIHNINNAISMSRADQLPTNLERMPTNAQVRALFEDATSSKEGAFKLEHKDMYSAGASGTESDFWGRVGGAGLLSDDIGYQAIGKIYLRCR